MQNYKATIILNRLSGASLEKDANGKMFVAIPVEENNIFISDRGNWLLSIACWMSRTGPDERGNTHTLKLSLPKDDPRAQNSPILGSLKPLVKKAPTMPYQQAGGPQWGSYGMNQQPWQQQPPYNPGNQPV